MRGLDGDFTGDWVFLRKAVWKERFALLPHRCRITKKWIWLKKGYKGTATYTGPGLPVTETHWHDYHQHLIWKLTYDSADHFSLILPNIRKTVPLFIAQDIVSVQPMTDIFKKKE